MASVIRGDDNFDSAVGGATTHGAVGTYTSAYVAYSASITRGSTISGSSLLQSNEAFSHDMERAYNGATASAGLSGTWRAMSRSVNTTESAFKVASVLWVRIS
jgi:hypothetical protein